MYRSPPEKFPESVSRSRYRVSSKAGQEGQVMLYYFAFCESDLKSPYQNTGSSSGGEDTRKEASWGSRSSELGTFATERSSRKRPSIYWSEHLDMSRRVRAFQNINLAMSPGAGSQSQRTQAFTWKNGLDFELTNFQQLRGNGSLGSSVMCAW